MSIIILKSKTHAVGWSIEPCFIITLHIKDIEILNAIQRFFKVGLYLQRVKNLPVIE